MLRTFRTYPDSCTHCGRPEGALWVTDMRPADWSSDGLGIIEARCLPPLCDDCELLRRVREEPETFFTGVEEAVARGGVWLPSHVV